MKLFLIRQLFNDFNELIGSLELTNFNAVRTLLLLLQANDEERRIKMGDIKSELNLAKSSATEVVKSLEDQGYIERTRSGRNVYVSLTSMAIDRLNDHFGLELSEPGGRNILPLICPDHDHLHPEVKETIDEWLNQYARMEPTDYYLYSHGLFQFNELSPEHLSAIEMALQHFLYTLIHTGKIPDHLGYSAPIDGEIGWAVLALHELYDCSKYGSLILDDMSEKILNQEKMIKVLKQKYYAEEISKHGFEEEKIDRKLFIDWLEERQYLIYPNHG